MSESQVPLMWNSGLVKTSTCLPAESLEGKRTFKKGMTATSENTLNIIDKALAITFIIAFFL
jgi:hypothetical protein